MNGQASLDVDPADGRNETAAQRSDRNWSDILQELRVTQTGTQIISGFLLAVAFQQRFGQLTEPQLIVYGVLVCLAAASTLIGLTAVALHRARFHRHEKPEIVALANRLLSIGAWVVAILTAGVVLFIFDFVFGLTAGVVAGLITLVAAILLLAALPRAAH